MFAGAGTLNTTTRKNHPDAFIVLKETHYLLNIFSLHLIITAAF